MGMAAQARDDQHVDGMVAGWRRGENGDSTEV
jgi:hypothetical protein